MDRQHETNSAPLGDTDSQTSDSPARPRKSLVKRAFRKASSTSTLSVSILLVADWSAVDTPIHAFTHALYMMFRFAGIQVRHSARKGRIWSENLHCQVNFTATVLARWQRGLIECIIAATVANVRPSLTGANICMPEPCSDESSSSTRKSSCAMSPGLLPPSEEVSCEAGDRHTHGCALTA